MSGSTIGGVVGGVIGFYFGGAKGAQMGWMIGSAVGGYVDPDVIQGPRLEDAQTQTSMEGAFRNIVYGTAVVGGNVIMCGPLVESKHRERTGKGGPVQETYVYTRTYAIGVCEGPIAGISRIWRDDKLVYDTRDPADWPEAAADIANMASDTAKFASGIHVYLGGETQLPDATLEGLPAANGGGMGNVPAFRGTAYVVFVNDDLTNRQGSIAQYRFEVVSAGTTTAGVASPVFGVQTDSYTLPSDASGIFSEYQPNYMRANDKGVFVAYADPAHVTGAGTTAYEWAQLDNHLVQTIGSNVDQNGGGYSAGYDLVAAEKKEKWSISNSGGYCQLYRNGAYCRNLVISGDADWWYGEGTYLAEFGGLVWFAMGPLPGGSVYIGSRKSGSSGTIRNRIYKWALDTAPGDYEYLSRSNVVTAGSNWYMHMDRSGLVWTISETEGELIQWDGDLNAAQTYTLPSPITTTLGAMACFGINGGYLFLASDAGSSIEVYELQTWTHVQTIAISGTTDDYNWQIDFNNDSIFLRAGRYLKRFAYAPSCVLGVPYGGYALPDNPNYVADSMGNLLPICGSENSRVTGDAIYLDEIVTDQCARAGVTADQIDVTQLTTIPVRGFVVGKQGAAGDNIRSLQRGYFFDFPEWGDYTDDNTKLRAIVRGGASVFTITDDDLVESDDDEDTRAQAVEFPRKINLITADVDADYNPTKQTFERRTDNVKAVGEVTVELPLAFRRSEAAPIVDIMGKVAWTESEGRAKRILPPEYEQYTPSDCGVMDGKRWRLEKVTSGDGQHEWEMVRDRRSSYTSPATSGDVVTPTTPTSSTRGPTQFIAANLPQLRTQDSTPGMYVFACGLLPGWVGCDLQLSIDSGATYTTVLRMVNPATMGYLTDDCGTSGGISVHVSDELDSVTTAQIAARANAFAILDNADLAEVGQFETATLTIDDEYDLTTITRGELGTVAAAHFAGERFVMLDGAMYFLPIDYALAGQTLRFRPVTLGTVAANNAYYDVVFNPGELVHDGGGDPL